MTLQLRPTFSESWYRVKDLKPRLRGAAQISRQHYRGERWYVVRDPAGNQFHRLSDVAYQFVGLLDGTRTVGEAWELVGGQLADDAPTQPEIIQILSQLYAANLIETNVSPDAQVLLRRQKKQRERKFQGRLMNLLFPRLPLWDPDRFLKVWMPFAGPMISRAGIVVWLLVCGFALFLMLPNLDRFYGQTQDFLGSGSVETWLLLGATFLVTKFLHEMGHAFACRRFGGECHEVGIMFLVLMPCPYVDASTAWGFNSKWKRILVGAGGMIAELFIASIAAIVWVATLDNGGTVNQVAYYTVLIASVSTVLFNANPLLRYDGYYILSDWLEIPNLQQRSREYSLGLVKRYIFRVKTNQPLPPTFSQKGWMVGYWVLSGLYRIFIGFAIIMMVMYQLPEQVRVIGYLLAIGAIATFFIVPMFKLFKYLTTDPELHRKRTRAWAFTLATAGVLAFCVGILEVPSAVRADAVAEPLDRARATVRTPGRVAEILVADGQQVRAGDVLMRLENFETMKDLEVARLRLAEAQTRLRAARVSDAGGAMIAQKQVERARRQLDDAEREAAELEVIAPVAGRVLAPRIEDRQGSWLNRGDPIAAVEDDRKLELFVAVSAEDYERVVDAAARDAALVQVRLASDLSTVVQGDDVDVRVMPAAAKNDLRSAALTYAGGGTIAPDPRDPNKAAAGLFELRLTVPNEFDDDRPRYMPGQRAHVRVKLDDEPIATQAWRGLLQMIQSNNAAASAG